VTTSPLSHAQQRLWFIGQSDPDSAAYNIPLVLQLEGAVDSQALGEALGDVVERHEVLRTLIVNVDDRPVAKVAPRPSADEILQIVPDAPGIVDELVRRTFDLARDLPVRATLVQREDPGWVFVLVLHHIAADGASMAALSGDLEACYRARLQGTTAALPPLELTYADFAAWHHEMLGDVADPESEAAFQLASWREHLQDAPEETPLPLARPRRPIASGEGNRVFLDLDDDFVPALERLAITEGVTPHMVLQAVTVAVLNRAGSGDDIVVGTPLAGRGDEGLADIIGLFVNTLPIRHRLSDAMTFRELLIQSRNGTLHAMENADLPFEVLVEHLNPVRSLNRHPLFQIGVGYQAEDDFTLALGADSTLVTDIDLGTAQFDMNVCLFKRPGDRTDQLEIEYATDLFDETAARTIGRWWIRLAEQALREPGIGVAALDLLDAAERDELAQWGCGAPAPTPRRFGEIFDAAVAGRPDWPAVIDGDLSLTYRELDARVELMARRVSALGARPGELVAFCLPKGIDAVVAILGIVRTGAAYLPIDPALPDDRVRHMIDDAAPLAVVADGVQSARFDVPLVLIDGDEQPARSDAWPVPSLDDVAYVIYTSGSTGLPKGVEVTHAGLSAALSSQIDTFDLDGSLRLLQLASFSFDVSVIDLLTTFSVAGTLILPGPDVAVGDELAALLDRHEITYCELTPSRLASLPTGAYPYLRAINLGGEECPPSLVAEWADGRIVCNTYGPTEATITSVASGALDGTRSPEIGRPTAGLVARVLDQRFRAVPAGVAGELYISGAGLARGYLHRPGLTASRFVADLAHPGERMYRTGDVVRWREDGQLEFVGRSDQQVKIRGQRIELGEVETTALRIDGVTRAAALVREDAPGIQRLVLYFVGDIDPAAARREIALTLPSYMVPSAVVTVPEIPLTLNGKLDVRALPMPPEPATPSGRSAATAQEHDACAVLADVLGVRSIGPDESFFDRGGQSLLAARLVSRWRDRMNSAISLRDVFEAPSPAALLDRAHAAEATEAMPTTPIVRVPRDEPIAASPSQSRLWLLAETSTAAALNVSLPLRVAGRIEVETLEGALADLLDRHEVLRTLLVEHDGTVWQSIMRSGTPVPLDVQHSGSADETDRILEACEARAFSLQTEVPIRCTVVREPDADIVVLVIHHVATDGSSLGPLARDLRALYGARAEGTAAQLPRLPIQYADYASHLRAHAAFDTDLAYWRTALDGLPTAIELPTRHPRPSERSGAGGWVPIEIDAQLHARLNQVARASNASLFMVIHAAVTVLLRRLGAGADIPVGTMVAGRDDPDLDELVGFFVNTLVLRTQVPGDATFQKLLDHVRDADLAAFEHQTVPFETLVEAMHPVHVAGLNPLFQVALTVMGDGEESDRWGFGALEAEPVDSATRFARFDLTIALDEHRADGMLDGLTGVLEYADDLWSREEIEVLTARLMRVLEQVADDPERRVSQIRITSDEEEVRAREVGDEPSPPAHMATLFRRQVALGPDNIAVECDGETITFAELDRVSDEYAALLRAQGVESEDIVGSCLPRSVLSIVVLLAVMKAGAVWQPLDPTYPDDRIAFLVEDAATRLVVCTAEQVTRFACNTLNVDAPDLPEQLSAAGPAPAIDPDARRGAYLIHTSGSTGQPKGVLVTHAGLAALGDEHRVIHGVRPGSVSLQFGSHSFDGSMWEMTQCLLAGSTMLMASESARQLGDELPDLIRRCTHIALTPSTVLALPTDAFIDGQTVILAGEALPGRLVTELAPRVDLRNVYGPTETTTDITTHVVAVSDADPVPIGGPVPGKSVMVLDEWLSPVADGSIGELYVGGASLARGYIGRSGLTASRFVADPFGRGDLLYRTGDLVRRGPDNVLRFVGRGDDQVKIRGFRIELGEVDAALSSAPNVVSAAAVVREDASDGAILVGYIVGPVDLSLVREHLSDTLPRQSVPTALVVLPEMPVTSQGKVDRRRLPAPVIEAAQGRAPKDAAEELRCRVMAEVLGLDAVGPESDFFQSGGHSLLAARLASRLRSEGCAVTVAEIFADPRPAAWTGEQAEPGSQITAVPRPADGLMPASPAQRRLWLERDLVDGEDAYNLPIRLVLDDGFDAASLRAALGDLVARHEPLRTRIVDIDGSPWQQIVTPSESLRLLDALMSEATDRSELDALARRPIDTATGLPLLVSSWRDPAGGGEFLLSVHHVAVDGMSMGPLLADLSVAYGARCLGVAPDWAPLGIQYADWAAAQAEALGDVTDPASLITQHGAWWRDALEGAPASSGLSPDNRLPEQLSALAGVLRVELGHDVLTSLHEIARAERSTLFMVVHAALAATICRVEDTRDITIGTVASGREDEIVSGLVGFFVNPIALRTRIDSTHTVRRWVRSVRDADAAAFAHDSVPFDEVVAMIGGTRGAQRHPIFQTVLTTLGDKAVAADEIPFGPTTARIAEDAVGAAKFDLTIAFSETDQGLVLEFEFATDLYESATVASFAQRLTSVLEQFASAPDRSIAGLDLLLPGERDRLAILGDGSVTDSAPAGLDDLFEAGLAVAGAAALAVEAHDRALTYDELERESAVWAARLRAAGAGPDVVVGVCVPRSADMAVAVLSAARSGAVVLPLDPAYPAARLRHLITDARPAVILAGAEGVAAARAGNADIPLLDMADSVVPETAVLPRPKVWPASGAYMIYTSGSTGLPKGVTISRSGLGIFARSLIERCGGWPGWRVLQCASLSFDASILEFSLALASGGTLVVPAPGPLVGPELSDALNTVDAALVTPGVLATLDPKSVTGVPVLISGAEALSADLVAAFAPGRRMYNAYGPTEATVAVAVAGPLAPAAGAPGIGDVLGAARLRVLDALLQPVPPGAVGELYLGGPGLATGYQDRPGTTAASFVADPASVGARLYRTGDFVRWGSDEQLHFVGRTDDQVKIRGFRVELAEVQASLGTAPGVTGAVVTAQRATAGDTLVAWVTPGDVDVDAVRRFVAASLPSYLVPTVISAVDEFPLTPNGKVDATRLKPAEGATRRGDAPRTPEEKQVAAAFAETLGAESVHRDDDFFALGGHSLLAARVVSILRGTGDTIRLRDVFDAPTPRLLAERLGRAGDSDVLQILPVVPRPHRVPASFAQGRLWMVSQLQGPTATYNIPLVSTVQGELDLHALGQALRDVMMRHESLRTIIRSDDGDLWQDIRQVPDVDDVLVVTDARSSSDADQVALIARCAAHVFDIDVDLPVRMWAIRETDERTALVLVLHHIAGDGASMAPFTRDLTAAYASRRRGAAPTWDALSVQYADYAIWQHGQSVDDDLDWWRAQLVGTPDELSLPASGQRRQDGQRAASTGHLLLSAQTHAKLASLATRHSSTGFMVFHAAVAALLHRLGGGSDICLGTVTSGRESDDVSDLIGFFVNTLAVRHDLTDDPTCAQTVERSRDAMLGALEHSRVPFDLVVDAVSPQRRPGVHPLFQVMVSSMDAEAGATAALELPGVQSISEEPDAVGAKFDLTFSVGEHREDNGRPAGMEIQVEYATDLFDDATAQSLLTRLGTLLEEYAAEPEQHVSGITLTTDAERQALCGPSTPRTQTWPELFAAGLALDPTAPAVRFEGEALSYAELDAQTNRLARWLIGRGVGPEVIVGAAVRKSLHSVVPILAIEKAGGAYLPIDPDYPPQRIADILEDAAPAFTLVTDADDATSFGDGAVLLPGATDLHELSAAAITDDDRLSPLTADSTAYVIFTSGSTGRAKGVVITHRGLAALAESQREHFGTGPGDGVMQFASLSFDASVLEITLAHFHGACLVVVPERLRTLPPEIGTYLGEQGVTIGMLVPSAATALAAGVLPDGMDLMMGGEALQGRTATAFRDGRRVHNLYGPTETTIDVTWHEVRDDEDGIVPIGTIVHGLSAQILDDHLEPLPHGVPGELYVSGSGLARGYLHRHGLSASRFVACPWAEDGAVMYRTGDVVVADAEGSLRFVGRSDRQVKIRGFRIELGEVEAALLALPGIHGAAVVTTETAPDDHRLVAYIATSGTVDIDDVRNRLGERLPGHAIPSSIMVLDALPTTINGKLDVAALPTPVWGSAAAAVEPEDGVESLLAELWSEVLGTTEPLSALDHFFTIGGNSLLAAKVSARVTDRLAVDLPLRLLFEHPVLRDQAAALEDILLADIGEN